MIGFSSYAGVMENVTNSAEEQQTSSPLANLVSNQQESSKNQELKPVGGFVLVHAGKHHNLLVDLASKSSLSQCKI